MQSTLVSNHWGKSNIKFSQKFVAKPNGVYFRRAFEWKGLTWKGLKPSVPLVNVNCKGVGEDSGTVEGPCSEPIGPNPNEEVGVGDVGSEVANLDPNLPIESNPDPDPDPSNVSAPNTVGGPNPNLSIIPLYELVLFLTGKGKELVSEDELLLILSRDEFRHGYFCLSCLCGEKHIIRWYDNPRELRAHIEKKHYDENRTGSGKKKNPKPKGKRALAVKHYPWPGMPVLDDEGKPVKSGAKHDGFECPKCFNTFIDNLALQKHMPICHHIVF